MDEDKNIIYIVTSGYYSDCSIEGVFKDKVKAEAYAALHDARVEEFELMDDKKIVPGYRITTYYRYPIEGDSKVKEVVEIKFEKVEIKDNDIPMTIFERHPSRLYLKMVRLVPGEISQEDFSKKYEKAAYDIMAYCKERLSSNYTDSQINEFLSSKYDRGKID